MPIELKVPSVGESITEVVIGEWLKKEGDSAQKDERLVDIESDKATVEVSAPVAGTLVKLLKKQGEAANVGEVIGYMEEGPATGASSSQPTAAPASTASASPTTAASASSSGSAGATVMPAARRELAERGLSADQVQATGPGGRLLKEDVQRQATAASAPAAKTAPAAKSAPAPTVQPSRSVQPTMAGHAGREEEVVPMTPIRKRIAERLVNAQHTAALLTTFNEIEMTAVMALRQDHKDSFQQKYGVKLGFTSFFIKAVVEGLKAFPALNAEIRGDSVVYHNYYDVGVAVSSAKGLVVPVLRNVERMSFAEIELSIEDFGKRARENKIKLDELEGGTFTISNGGVFGSLLSTPIINPPQSGILGLHAIQERPVARDGQCVVRSMMYVALTYDHRIVDGREAVTFLRRIKEGIEQPARLLLEV